ncbi:MAG: DUF4623 domain-containing protein [Limisphaerales bacterium]
MNPRHLAGGIALSLSTWAACSSASAVNVLVSPLSSFGSGDGWFAPGEGGYTYLGTGNLERGLAFGNGELYLVSRQGGVNVRRLSPITGTDLGGLDVTGIAGGTFAANMVGVGGDGAIYVGNLSTAANSNFKVYRWSDSGAAPTTAYDGAPGAPRLGDSFAVHGSGTETRIIASGSGTTGFALIDPTLSTGSLISVAGTGAGDYRLGITFADNDTVIGAQGTTPFRVTDIVGTDGVLVASPATASASERFIAYTVLAGVPLFASVDSVSSAVRIYDASDLASPQLLATVNNTSGTLAANGNGVGALTWGPNFGDSAFLYAMSANQGIQAFVVTVPEPATTTLLLIGGGLLLGARRRRG